MFYFYNEHLTPTHTSATLCTHTFNTNMQFFLGFSKVFVCALFAYCFLRALLRALPPMVMSTCARLSKHAHLYKQTLPIHMHIYFSTTAYSSHSCWHLRLAVCTCIGVCGTTCAHFTLILKFISTHFVTFLVGFLLNVNAQNTQLFQVIQYRQICE